MNQTIENIISIRKKLSIKQSEIADEFGYDRSFYNKLENTGKKVDVDLLIFLAKKFKMSIDDIINYHLKSENLVNEAAANNEQTEKPDHEIFMNQIEDFKFLVLANQSLVESLQEENKKLKKQLKEFKGKIECN